VSRWIRLAVLLAGGAVVALGAQLATPGTGWAALALIGGAIAVGDLIELCPPRRRALPISFAYAVVLARRATISDGLLVILVALLASFLMRSEPVAVEQRLLLFLERFVACASAVVVFHVAFNALQALSGRERVVLALIASAFAPLVVAEVARMARERTLEIPGQGRSADLALVTSAVLMAISDEGVNGHGAMGLWGPLVFTIPLLAACYSYEHLDEIRRTYDQTIRALGAAPELGGMVLEGHAERVAGLSAEMADELGFARIEIEHLEMAALLHHLGQVCLDEPEPGHPAEPSAVAMSGAAILRSTELLAPAGDIIAAEALPYRESDHGRASILSGQILKVASAFDELCEGRDEQADAALEVLYSAPAYMYDEQVLAALDLVLDRRGVLTAAS
jgi:hypothetical protein